MGGEVQGITHIELILKDQRKRGNFIGQEERESTFPSKERNRQEFAIYPLGQVTQKFLLVDVLETKIKLLGSNGSIWYGERFGRVLVLALNNILRGTLPRFTGKNDVLQIKLKAMRHQTRRVRGEKMRLQEQLTVRP